MFRYLGFLSLFVLVSLSSVSVKAALYISGLATNSQQAAYNKWSGGGSLTTTESAQLGAYFAQAWQFGRTPTSNEAGFLAEYFLAATNTATLGEYENCDITYDDVRVETLVEDDDGNPVYELDDDGFPLLDDDGLPIQSIEVTFEPFVPPTKTYGYNDGIANDANILDCVKNEVASGSGNASYSAGTSATNAAQILNDWYLTSTMSVSDASNLIAQQSLEMVYSYMDAANVSFFAAYEYVYSDMFPTCFYAYDYYFYSPSNCVNNAIDDLAEDMVDAGPPGCDNQNFYTNHNVLSAFITPDQFSYCGGGMSDSESVEAAQAVQEMEQNLEDFATGLQGMMDADFSLDAYDQLADSLPGGLTGDLGSGFGGFGSSGSDGYSPNDQIWDSYIDFSLQNAPSFDSDWTFGVPIGDTVISDDPFGPIRFSR